MHRFTGRLPIVNCHKKCHVGICHVNVENFESMEFADDRTMKLSFPARLSFSTLIGLVPCRNMWSSWRSSASIRDCSLAVAAAVSRGEESTASMADMMNDLSRLEEWPGNLDYLITHKYTCILLMRALHRSFTECISGAGGWNWVFAMSIFVHAWLRGNSRPAQWGSARPDKTILN